MGMLKSKTADRLCCAALALMLVLTGVVWTNASGAGGAKTVTQGYEGLFDTGFVHTIDIEMEDWDAFIASATQEEYALCSVTIDGERIAGAGIRGKGNTSLSSVAGMGSEKYSFKIEFDHFAGGQTYRGLDKLSLNNLIYDATMMKDYLAYTLMARMDVPSPLCSYARVTVNGEPWGLYLAVEGVEDSFLNRNRMTAGELYKPDSMSFGGGRGNGGDFDFDEIREKWQERLEESGIDPESLTLPDASFAPSFGGAAPAGTAQPGAEAGGNPTGQNGLEASFGGSAGTRADPEGAAVTPDPETGSDPAGQNGLEASFGGSAGTRADPNGASAAPSAEASPNPAGQNGLEASFGGPAGTWPGGFDPSSVTEGRNRGAMGFGMGSDDVKLIYTDDDPESYANIFSNAKTNVTRQDQARLIRALQKLNAQQDIEDTVYTDEVIRFLAVHGFLCNDDSYTGTIVHNYYLYEQDGRLAIIPWDYNLAFGAQSMGFGSSGAAGLINSPVDSPVSGGDTSDRPLIAWIFSDADAMDRYHAAYDRFLADTVESGWLEKEISRVSAMIRPEAEADPNAFYTLDAFDTAISALQTFCSLRAQSVRGQLEGSIPSTSEAQTGSAALVDAGDLNVSDMGTMGGFNGQGGRNGFGGQVRVWAQGSQALPGASFDPGQARTAQPPAEEGENQAKQAQPPDTQTAEERGFAGGMPMPDRSANEGGMEWGQLALYAAVLLLSILALVRVPGHNRS